MKLDNKEKLSAADYEDLRNGIQKLRTIIYGWILLEMVSLVLFFVLTILVIYEQEAAIKITGFIGDHPIISIGLSVAGAIVALLYYIQIMDLRKFHGGLLVAGVLGVAAFVYAMVSDTSSVQTLASGIGISSRSIYESVLTKAATNALILLVLGTMFRKTYYSAMSEGAMELSVPVSRQWKGLWELTLIVTGCAVFVVLVARALVEYFISSFLDSSLPYSEILGRFHFMQVLLVLVTAMAGIVDIILQIRELYCLQETAEVMFPRVDENAPYRS